MCLVTDCPRPIEIRVHGLCRPHYKRLKRYGDPIAGQPMRLRSDDPAEIRRVFLSRFVVTESGCHEWTRARDLNGYGRVGWEGRPWLTHRVAWTLLVGPIPTGQNVLHHCDNPPCGNPAHLFLGSQTDNMRDAWNKGRACTPTFDPRH